MFSDFFKDNLITFLKKRKIQYFLKVFYKSFILIGEF